VRDALEQELPRQRRIRRIDRLQADLPYLQEKAAAVAKPFDDDALLDVDGLSG
jgi:hypothetical protein